MLTTVARPRPEEFAEFYRGYIDAVAPGADGLAVLEEQVALIEALGRLTPAQAGHRYEPGKWTPREVIGHVVDCERVFAYRLLRVARGDETPLPAFDETLFAANSNADRRDPAGLAAELLAVRRSSLALVRSLDESMLARVGTASGRPVSARALVFIMAGHVAHHARILRERYGLPLDASGR